MGKEHLTFNGMELLYNADFKPIHVNAWFCHQCSKNFYSMYNLTEIKCCPYCGDS